MIEKIEVSFPGAKRVDAKIGNMAIATDQSLENGGTETAPEPFLLFLASIATCAGIYALEFLQARDLSSEGMALTMGCEWDEKKRAIEIGFEPPENLYGHRNQVDELESLAPPSLRFDSVYALFVFVQFFTVWFDRCRMNRLADKAGEKKKKEHAHPDVVDHF